MADRKNDPVRLAQQRQRELIALKKAQQGVEPLETAEPTPEAPMTSAQKAQNFWFYYRYHLLALALAAVVLAVCITQCVRRPKYDYEIVLFTYSAYLDNQLEAMRNYFAQYGEDCNQDGVVQVGIIDCSYSRNVPNSQLENANLTKVQTLLANEAKAMLYITDPESIEYLNKPFENGMMADLGLPDGDGKTYRLPASFYEAVEQTYDLPEGEIELKLPEGMQISRRVISGTMVGSASGADVYAAQADAFLKRLVAAGSN